MTQPQQFDIISELYQLRLIPLLIPYLTPKEFKTLRLTNKSYNTILTTSYKVSLLIKLNNYNYNEELANILRVQNNFGNVVNEVSIKGMVKNGDLFRVLASKFINLTELNLSEVKINESCINQLNQLKSLNSLKIKNLSQYNNNTDNANNSLFNLNLPQLSRLSLEYSDKSKTYVNFIFPNFKGLRELVYLTIKLDKIENLPIIMNNEYDSSGEIFELNGVENSKLNYLHLEFEGNTNQLQYIYQNLTPINNLLTLKLKSTLNTDYIIQYLINCKSLQKLQLNLNTITHQEELFKLIYRNQRTLLEFKLNNEIELQDYFNQLIFCDLTELKILSCYLKDQPSIQQTQNSLPNLIELNLPNTILNLDLLPSSKNLIKLECLSLEVNNLTLYPKLIWLKSGLITNSINDIINSSLIGDGGWIWLKNNNSEFVDNGSSVIGIRINN